MNKKPPVIFIAIDALRCDGIGCLGGSIPTPHIDKLAERGILFRRAYACTNHTNPSFTSIFSGMYPQSHGIIHQTNIAKEEIMKVNKVQFLAEIMRSNGYATLGVDFLGRWHKRGFDYYGVGQSKYEFKESIAHFLDSCIPPKIMSRFRSLFAQAHLLPYPTADEQTDTAVSLINKHHNSQFFLFVHYWDTHIPYNSPDKFIKNRGGNKPSDSKPFNEIIKEICYPPIRLTVGKWMKGLDLDSIISRYYGAVSFVDHEIGRLLDALKRHGILDEALTILTADHGESLGEHGIYFGHYGLYEVTVHVPLVIKYPDLSRGVIDGFVQHVDIVPTILDLLNIGYRTSSFDGRSMLPLVHEGKEIRSAVVAEESPVGVIPYSRAIRTNEYKYIETSCQDIACKYCKRSHVAKEELYDLERDPDERRNIASDQPFIAHNCQKILQETFKKFGGIPGGKASEYKWSKDEEEKIRRRLKDLGYLG